MKKWIVLSSLLLASLSSSAAILETKGSGTKIEKLTLPTEAIARVNEQEIPLTSVGAGLRSKKVVFVNVKVYVGQLYVADTAAFQKSEASALTSLKTQNAVAIQMHFLRDVDAENVQNSFQEALKVNGIATDSAEIKQFLTSVSKGGEAKSGKSLIVLGHRHNGQESVFYEDTAGNVSEIKGGEGFIEKVFSIWLGKAADSGVAKLKSEILK